ncbi:XdhC family protein [Cohaesibacter marisflavi]|uniref:XdhC family protein n=1 Tax=Cohaesibacter marisflavi TaxID=655353 RepID=UPI0038994405
MKVFKELIRENEAGRPCALASIVTTNGSIPASDKAKMLVCADRTIVGTVGGGAGRRKDHRSGHKGHGGWEVGNDFFQPA